MATIWRSKPPMAKSKKEGRPPIPKKIREKVLNMFGGKCAYCGRTPKKLQVDHVIPFSSNAGTDDESNLMPACRECNNFKHSYTLEEFRRELQEQAKRAYLRSVNYRMALRYGLIDETGKRVVFYFERFKNGR